MILTPSLSIETKVRNLFYIAYQENTNIQATESGIETRNDATQNTESETGPKQEIDELEGNQSIKDEEDSTKMELPDFDKTIQAEENSNATSKEEIKEQDTVETDVRVSEENEKATSGSEDMPERKSYPVILEAKPQHSGPAVMKMVQDGSIKEEDATNTASLGSEEMVVNGVLIPTDTSNGQPTIVQYAVDQKLEEGPAVQVNGIYYLFTA